MRYSWETLKVLHCFFLSRASWIQWRSPSLGVSGREASWDPVWVACCVFRSFVCLSVLFVPPLFVPTSLLVSLSSSPFSLPSHLLSPSFHPFLPAFHLPPSFSRYLTTEVILLPLRPASLTHKNPQGREIIRGKRPVGRKEWSFDRSIFVWFKLK